ncbi:uncharacterized protein LOC127877657 isoform X2 [Dreissena polymorpha]|uniref:Ubiquitin-like domain-containing protein n=1 Tax=Dreissena polymorpha TaxID=45954 RepID=A0A9D4KC83_DREPO|nr:uncharacterized protein LOC127877657 isoform X2 [Dreissena polymorpha]KAH3836606.1 hypothetical protein DPMN_109977 [Dreissena polymorpha]
MASSCVDVYVKLPNGKAIESQLLPSDTVRLIAEKVAISEHVPVSRVRLKYQGKVVNKLKTIGFLGICAETILKAEILCPKDISLEIRTQDGGSTTIVARTTDTVGDLGRVIEDLTGIGLDKQALKFSGTQLKEHGSLLCDEGLTDGSVVTVVVATNDAPADKDGTGTQEDNEHIKQSLCSSFNVSGRHVDVVFCFDTTGSMASCLAAVRAKLRESCQRLLRDIPNMRIGIIAHGDYCDQHTYVVRHVDLTNDVDVLVDFANNVPSTGGGDSPEAYEWALRRAHTLDWSESSAKALVMIGDEVPHPPSYTDQGVFWMDELDVLIGMGIKVYGVRALESTSSEPFYLEMAERSGGYYLRLQNLSLITDMFLAVCYRESDSNQLEAFVAEVEQEGRMTENTKHFLDALEKTSDKTGPKDRPSTDTTRRYVKQPWWDPTLDQPSDNHQYVYDVTSDKWSERRRQYQTAASSATPVTHSMTLRREPVNKSLLRRVLSVLRIRRSR